MSAPPPTRQALSAAIAHAVRLAVQRLFREHPEDFYYIALITTGEAHAPFLSAWSKQALAVETRRQGLASGDLLKWSYADSPYVFFGEDCFGAADAFSRAGRVAWHRLRPFACGSPVRPRRA